MGQRIVWEFNHYAKFEHRSDGEPMLTDESRESLIKGIDLAVEKILKMGPSEQYPLLMKYKEHEVRVPKGMTLDQLLAQNIPMLVAIAGCTEEEFLAQLSEESRKKIEELRAEG